MDSKINQEVRLQRRTVALQGRYKRKAKRLSRKPVHGTPVDPGASLTLKEREVLAGIASGACDEEIAERMNTDLAEVKVQIDHICKKLNAPNRLQAVLWAAAHL